MGRAIYVLLGLALGLLTTNVSLATKLESTQKGYYKVYCGDKYVSRHSRSDKATVRAVNEMLEKKQSCKITQPDLWLSLALPPGEGGVTQPPVDPGEPDDGLRDVSLSWDIPTEREDGTKLPKSEIKGYVIKYGPNPDSLESTHTVDGGSTTSTTIVDLVPAKYYFAIATVDSDDVRGDFSPVISTTITLSGN